MPTVFNTKTGEFEEIDAKKKGVIELNDATTVLIKGDRGEKGDAGESIKGDPGADGRDGVDGSDGKDAKGLPGKDGRDGTDGKDAVGTPGKDGRGIASMVEKSGNAEITYTDGAKQIMALPKGTDGREVELSATATHVQWRFKGEKDFKNLFAIPKSRVGKGGGGGATVDSLNNILVAGSNITLTTANDKITIAGTGGGGGHAIQEEGTPLTARANLNFVGAGVAATDDAGNNATVVTVGGYTDEAAQDAVGGMVDATLVYVDGTPLLTRGAITGDVAIAQASNTSTLATVNGNVGSFTNANITVNAKGLVTAAANGSAGGTPVDITVANEATDTTTFPLFVTAATGDLGPKTNAGLAFNSNTGMLTVTGVTAPLTGNASTATALQNARTIGGTSFDGTANIVPATITIANEATDITCFPLFATAATGDLGPKSNAGLTFNSNTGVLAATGFSGPLTGNVTGNLTGNSDTVTVSDAGGDTTTFPMLATAATGSLAPATDAGLSYNATSNALSTTTFIGALTGNSDSATLATTATNVTVANEATDTTCFPLFVTAATGNLPPKSNTSLAFNSNTASLACTTFVGALTGNASTATALTTARAIGGVNFDGTAAIVPQTIESANEATDTTCFPLFITASGTQQLQPKNNTGLTYNSNTNNFGCTTFTGALVGNSSTATALATARAIGGVNFDGTAAIVPQTIQSVNEATDTTCFPLFITASGTQSLQPMNNTALTFNSNTGALGATSLVGTLTTASQTNITGVGTITTGVWNATDVPLSAGGTGATLSDPNADRFMFWDDSAGAVDWLTAGNGLTITTTTVAVDSASDTVDGIVELATAAETTTGTDATRAVTPDGLAGSDYGKRIVGVLVSDPQGAAITTGDGKACFRIPSALNGYNLVVVAASVSTVSSSGIPTVQLRRSRRASATTRTDADMLSTKLTVDASEFDSVDAAAAAVIDAANDDVSTGDNIYIDIDVAGTGAKGLFIEMQFQLP